MMVDIKMERLVHAGDNPIPFYATAGSAGADVCAALDGKSVVVAAGARVLIPTGLKALIPDGYEIQIRPRSGLAFKHGITVLNSPATIDADYRGEIKVLLINHCEAAFVVEHGMRIAQFVVAPVTRASFQQTDSIAEGTERGTGGFGSTGM
ncbi:MAG: dUTP diphosphatase [Alphaproteobacteria bacterium]|nr:MAG: dUTP diphosphatase [Alphaproteobacteria bacterium]